MTMQAMVETLENSGFDVKKFYDTNLKGYRFTIRRDDRFTSAIFEYPADTSREYCDARQREFIDYIINKWHKDHFGDADDAKLKKKIVFVGVSHKYAIGSVLRNATEELSTRGIPTSKKSIYYAGFETPHVHVRCVCSGDDDTDLQGLRADAVFGSLWDVMIRRMNPGADNWRKLDICLVDYICMIEREASESGKALEIGEAFHEGLLAGMRAEPKKIYISTASPNNPFCKSMMNSVYGTGEHYLNANRSIVPKVAFMLGRGNGKSWTTAQWVQAVFDEAVKNGTVKTSLTKFRDISSEDIEQILKQSDHLIQQKLYAALMKGENTMPTKEENVYRQNVNALANAMKRISDTVNPKPKLPGIKTVHFSGPVTAVIWEDKTKTLVRCKDGEEPDYEKGLAMAIAKKALGTNKSGSNYYDIFKKWLPKPEEEDFEGFPPEPKEE